MPTLTMKLASLLAAASAAMAAPAAAEDMLAVMGQDALDEQSYSVFANCVQGLDSAYKAYADEGVLVVIPPTNRAIDIDNTDKALWNCIESSSSTVSLAAESSEFQNPAREASADLKAIQHAEAVSMGVTGQKVVGHVVARTNGLEARTVNYYAVHHADDKDCKGDFNHYDLNRCYSFPSKFGSTMADNLDKVKHLRYTIWPHHSCEKGDQRIIDINPNSSSTCQVKPTFSWNGRYI